MRATQQPCATTDDSSEWIVECDVCVMLAAGTERCVLSGWSGRCWQVGGRQADGCWDVWQHCWQQQKAYRQTHYC